MGMLIHLASNSTPDIAMAVQQCARYTHNPCCIHDVAVKRVVHYLIGTKGTREGQIGYCGMVINPTDDLTLGCFVDANFAGLWGHEDDQDPRSVKSCTGWLLKELSQQLELDKESLSTASTMWEDSNGALALAIMSMPCMTPCSKHIGVKYHWFHSWINEPSNGIVVKHTNSKEQRGNISTKPLGRLESPEKRKMLVG
eukprot:12274400-Ditylum_brightwellii.AAC.1